MFQISCDDIKAAYEAQKKAFMAKSENAGKKFRDFNGFLVDSVNTQLHLVDKYNYDGVIMGFNAKLTHYLNDKRRLSIAFRKCLLGYFKRLEGTSSEKRADYDGTSTACRRQEPT